jgi:hypothetical protein
MSVSGSSCDRPDCGSSCDRPDCGTTATDQLSPATEEATAQPADETLEKCPSLQLWKTVSDWYTVLSNSDRTEVGIQHIKRAGAVKQEQKRVRHKLLPRQKQKQMEKDEQANY